MATSTRRRRRHTPKEWVYKDFESVLELPERLARILRLLLHLSTQEWDFCLDKLRQKAAYREWAESKGPGRGVRRYAAPCDELKSVQRKILNRFLISIPVHFCRHGNQRGCSVKTNAEHHAGNERAFSIDIVNAFPSVYRSRIRANLRKPFTFALKQFSGQTFEAEEIKQMLESLVDLVCLHDRLPQGPPTSPRILDIVCCKMDQDIWKLISENSTPLQEYRITVWCDDLTISFEEEIPGELRKRILAVMKKNGFFPHERKDKTKYFTPKTGAVPVITGIVLAPDGRITLAPNKLNQFRARINKLLAVIKAEPTKQVYGEIAGTIGYLRHIYSDKLPSKVRAITEKAETELKTIKFNELAGELGKKPRRRKKTTAVTPEPQTSETSAETQIATEEPPRRRSRKKKDTADESIPFK
ncbi:hypothetical protein HYW94_00785 [Candidatus Uhrbacteria bacterium]|nr:hypothetical protein [Candidatus Uhrbacteria bacterium]